MPEERGFFIRLDRETFLSPSLTAMEKLVLAGLSAYADWSSGQCFPSIARLARDLNVTKPTVRHAVDGLVEKGIARRLRRPTGKGLLHETNVYVVPSAANKITPTPNNGAEGSKADELPSKPACLSSKADCLHRKGDCLGVGNDVDNIGKHVSQGSKAALPERDLINKLKKQESGEQESKERELQNDNAEDKTSAQPPKTALSNLQRAYLETFKRKRFATEAQKTAVGAIEAEYGYQVAKQALEWAARKGFSDVDRIASAAKTFAKPTGKPISLQPTTGPPTMTLAEALAAGVKP